MLIQEAIKLPDTICATIDDRLRERSKVHRKPRKLLSS